MALQGRSALVIAAGKGHAAVLEYLLAKGAAVDLKSSDVSLCYPSLSMSHCMPAAAHFKELISNEDLPHPLVTAEYATHGFWHNESAILPVCHNPPIYTVHNARS